MIRLCANLSKKVPGPVQFSSNQFGCSLEIEVSDADKPEAIQTRIRELYNLLSITIDEQIGIVHPNTAPTLPPPAPEQIRQPVPQQRTAYVNGNGRNRLPAANGYANGNGRAIGASPAQTKAIWAICKSLGIEVADALNEIGFGDLQTLSVKQASQLIDSLKSRQNGVH